MKSIIGSSQKEDIKQAVSEATKNIKSAKAIIVTSEYYKLQETVKIIQEKYPEAMVIGASGMTFCNDKSSYSGLVITAFVDEVQVVAGVVKLSFEQLEKSVFDVVKKVEEINPEMEDTVCIEFCTGKEKLLVSFFNKVFKLSNALKNKMGLVGGTVYGYPSDEKPFVTLNGEIYYDACVYLFIKNLKGKVKTYKENIYGKSGNTATHIATKVDLTERELIELDGRPASDVYAEEIGIPKDMIADFVYKRPLGRIIDNDIFIYSQHTLNDNGSLVNSKIINEYDELCFLTLLDYDKINRETRESIKKDIPTPSLIYSIDCAHRCFLFDGEKYLDKYLKNMASIGPYAGIFSGGEQFGSQHMNQTMVCVVFE